MDLQYATSENYSTSLRDSPSTRNGKDDRGYVYKKSSYQYSNAGKNNISYQSTDRNIDQLDELLEDLKNERKHTKDIELVPSSMMYRSLQNEKNEPPGTVSKTTRIIKTSQMSGSNQVPIEIENLTASDYSTLKSSRYSSRPGTLKREEYQINDIGYGSSQNILQNVYENKQKVYKSTNTFENIDSKAPTDNITTSHFTEDLQNIALSDDILPVPGVKVTTTVRTYTYEIPADSSTDVSGNRTLLYKNNNYNTIQRNEVNRMIQSPPPTVIYNTESYSTLRNGEERPIISNTTKEIRDHMETTTTHSDFPPPHRNFTDVHPNGTNKTIVYKMNTTEDVHSLQEPVNHRSPPQSTNYPRGPTTNRYYYHESSNVINSNHGPGSPGGPNGGISPPHNNPPIGYPQNNDEYYPKNQPNTSSVIYKYSTTTTNSNQGPDYKQPSHLSQPAPFPVDGRSFPVTNGNPPQRVDDLMQSFGNSDAVDKSDMETPHRKREVETAVATPNQQKIPSINKAGKDVYYPPGHEMMLVNREEMASGSAGGGRWAKGSGMYEYESGYKSKSKTKSGGAVVPVCLPLCCAMPCSIM